jgi:hypothetical protein
LARHLDGLTVSQRRTKRQLALIQDVCDSHGVKFSEGNVSVEVLDPRCVADAVMRLAQATIRISDLSFTFRTRLFESFIDEVADFLEEKRISLREMPGSQVNQEPYGGWISGSRSGLRHHWCTH